jgi:hypothetical protein
MSISASSVLGFLVGLSALAIGLSARKKEGSLLLLNP